MRKLKIKSWYFDAIAKKVYQKKAAGWVVLKGIHKNFFGQWITVLYKED